MRGFINSAAPVLGHLAQALQQQQAAPAYYQEPVAPEPAPTFDPFEPETVRTYIQSEINRGIEEGLRTGLGVYEPLLETVASTEGERQARAVLDSLEEQVGAFDQDSAMILAAGLMSQGNVMPEHALRVSAQYLHEMEARIREDERTRYIEELRGLQSAPSEHPVNGGPAASEMETVPTGPQRYQTAIERALARRNATLPIG